MAFVGKQQITTGVTALVTTRIVEWFKPILERTQEFKLSNVRGDIAGTGERLR